MNHKADCRWILTTNVECEYRQTHHYCPHPEHACDCTETRSAPPTLMERIRAIIDAETDRQDEVDQSGECSECLRKSGMVVKDVAALAAAIAAALGD